MKQELLADLRYKNTGTAPHLKNNVHHLSADAAYHSEIVYWMLDHFVIDDRVGISVRYIMIWSGGNNDKLYFTRITSKF